MRTNYLHQDWEDQIRNQILTSMLMSSKSLFWNWSQQLLKLNCLLHGTASAFDDTALHNHLKAHLDEELCTHFKHNEAHKDKVLKMWITYIHLIDEAHAVETKWHHELIEEMFDCHAKCQNTKTDTLWGSFSLWKFCSIKQCTYWIIHLFICQTPSPYRHWMYHVEWTWRVHKVPSILCWSSFSTIETVNSDEDISATVAILPNSPSEYASNSDEDWDVLHHEVSHPLLHGKHLIWNCQIHSLMDEFLVKTCTLIDNSVHLVLISPDLVDHLGLKKYWLHKPELVNVSFSSEKKKTELYYYVKLSLSSLDSVWTSCIVKAIITPGLCLPWLELNLIVTDHATCTCIDRIKSYDLLNPPPSIPPPPTKPHLWEQIKMTKADKKLVLAKLMMVCHDCFKNVKLKPEEVKEFDMAGAIRDLLEMLVVQEQLDSWERQLKTEYKEIFEPIPHADELPHDVVVEIHIKNAEKTIKSWSYPSLQKCKEAWQILIKQHL